MPSLHIEFPRYTAEYQLVDSEISRAWQQLIVADTLDLTEICNWQIYDPGFAAEALDRLRSLTQQRLWNISEFNQWHERFEHTQHCYDPQWHEINLLIHQAQWSTAGKSRVGYFHYSADQLDLPEITDEQRRDFQYAAQPGDLVLGYHTIGKDLWAAYTDRDHQLVRNGAVTAQQRLGPEFIMVLDQPPQSYQEMAGAVESWLQEQGLRVSHSDLAQLGRPLLGKLVGSVRELEEGIGWDKPQKAYISA